MKKNKQTDEAEDAENLEKWTQIKSNTENFIEKYKDKIDSADLVWKEKIENENPQILREQITRTFSHIPTMGVLLAKSEKQYREMQQKASLIFPTQLRSDARKFWLDGECSGYRYQRDIFDIIHKGLINKMSAQKSILASLCQEARDLRFE